MPMLLSSGLSSPDKTIIKPMIIARNDKILCNLNFFAVACVVTRVVSVAFNSPEIGAPHFGQADALFDIDAEHSGQVISDIFNSLFRACCVSISETSACCSLLALLQKGNKAIQEQ